MYATCIKWYQSCQFSIYLLILSKCFPNRSRKINGPLLQKDFEEKGCNSDSMSSEKQINNNQMVFVNSKVIKRCNETIPINKIIL